MTSEVVLLSLKISSILKKKRKVFYMYLYMYDILLKV